ncbi:MAG: hypothetical protein LBE35_01780 [Clostridiales bacterium]|jgi:hypothetical protein|nr:hypothetical protein [Clostridiales bacterium]
MKRLLLILAIFIFAACGGVNNENYIYEEPYEAEQPYEAAQPETTPPLNPVFPSGRTRAEYLEDLDFMEYIIYNNFPFTGVIYRRLGFDIFEAIENMRHIVNTRLLISSDAAFLHLLRTNIFEPAQHFGHFGLITPEWGRGFLNTYADLAINHDYTHLMTWVNTFNNPTSRSFYGLADADFENPEQRIFTEEGDGGWENIAPNARTEILEEGRIALITIPSMSAQFMHRDAALLLDFYREIADFEHLIIDIRGNGGGSSSFWPYAVMGPNIDETLYTKNYLFMMEHEHNLSFFGYFEVSPVNEDLLDGLIYLHPENHGRLDLYRIREGTIHPRFDQGIFRGKIWMLVDRHNFSAAENAADITKQTGFATLVGTTTGGDGIGTDPALVALPNSGIVFRYSAWYGTDIYGRNNQEFPTEPDIPNMPGKDALRTVLYLIN